MKIGYSFAALLSFVVAGCGAGHEDAKEPIDQPDGEQTESATGDKGLLKGDDAKTASSTGEILRSDLNKVLAAGPAALLAEILTDPVRENGRFVGFRIAKFVHGEPESIDLKTGDVILLVNGRQIERPENYFEIFEELKVAREIRFKVMRDGKELELIYPIVD
jgi:type II secretory pathway component PulC